MGVMPWTHVATIESDTAPGVEYEIKRAGTGRLACSCQSYRWARGTKTCKHLDAYRLAGSAPIVTMPTTTQWNRSTASWTSRPASIARAVSAETFTIQRAISLED